MLLLYQIFLPFHFSLEQFLCLTRILKCFYLFYYKKDRLIAFMFLKVLQPGTNSHNSQKSRRSTDNVFLLKRIIKHKLSCSAIMWTGCPFSKIILITALPINSQSGQSQLVNTYVANQSPSCPCVEVDRCSSFNLEKRSECFSPMQVFN